MAFYYNANDKNCKSITGAVTVHDTVVFRVYGEGDEAPILILVKDMGIARRIPMQPFEGGWSVSVSMDEVGLFFYSFKFPTFSLSRGSRRIAFATNEMPSFYQITVCDEHYKTPDWFKGGVMYQIFPDRFHKVGENPIRPGKVLRDDWGGIPSFRPNDEGKVLNNDFFGGNLAGITAKLDYLASLSVNTIYLNPIFEAYSNHRYDTGDYKKIDSLLGTEEDLKTLISEAKRRGMHILLDGVFSHTGADSLYFNKYSTYDSVGAYQSCQSEYYAWYNFEEHPDRYSCWWGIDTLPAVNKMNESYRDYLFGQDGVLRHWLRYGVDGYRLDVADELPPEFLTELRACVKDENEEALILGEVWEDASNKFAYGRRREYFLGHQLDSVMNYPIRTAIIEYMQRGDPTSLRETIEMLIDHYPKPVLDCLMNLLGTHDTPRILSVLGGEGCATKEEMALSRLSPERREIALQRLKLAAVIQFTLPGVPCIYYGDEIAMEGYADPFCRRCYDWLEQDESLLQFYRALGSIRGNAVFADGTYRELYVTRSLFVYERYKDGASVIVAVNRGSERYILHLRERYRDLIGGETSERFLVGEDGWLILGNAEILS